MYWLGNSFCLSILYNRVWLFPDSGKKIAGITGTNFKCHSRDPDISRENRESDIWFSSDFGQPACRQAGYSGSVFE